MAGNKGVGEPAAFLAVSRKVALLAVGVVSLLVLGGAAAFIVDAVEVTGPQLPFHDPCGQGRQNAFLGQQGSDPGICQWIKAMSPNFARTVLLQVSETGSGSFEATATITTVAADPLVTMVQRGAGQDANTFVEIVIGDVTAGQNVLTWSAPTVTMNSAGTTAVISTAGQSSDQLPIPGTVQLRVDAGFRRGTVEVSTQNRVIAGVSEDNPAVKVASESAYSLTVDNPDGELLISLQPSSPQPFSSPPGLVVTHRAARIAATAWELLSGFAGMLVPAGAWIAVFLASRMGAFGGVGHRPAWRRMERILGAVVVAHLVISACFQLSITEGDLSNSLLFDSSLPQHLTQAMMNARLWIPNGYVAVDGGVVLLIAFALVTAAWDPRHHKRAWSRGRRMSPLIFLAIGGAATVTSYVALAHASAVPGFSEVFGPDGSVQRSVSYAPLAAEIPVVMLCSLLVVWLAAAWACGVLSSGPGAIGGSPGLAAIRLPRTRGAIGAVTLIGCLALIGAGMGGAIAYRRVWLSVDAFTLWAVGALATLIALSVLLASLPRLRPPAPPAGLMPKAKAPPTLIILAWALLVVLAISLPFFLEPYLVFREYPDDGTGQFSGTTVLIACLSLAAFLALGTAVASRPWRAGNLQNRWYPVAALIAILAITATLTNAGGYVPVLLRWGVLIIAGTFLGMAVARLTVTAVGPLRAPANRMPHLLAATLIAAVIAVPWGELGHDIQVSWWDLLTYGNRIDGILPLILVAAGVTALRRLGLVPRRNEETLSGHRRLGIAAWVVALSASYTFGGTADLAAVGALVAAAIAAWFLMPRRQVPRASVILGQSAAEAAAAVRLAVEIGVARRTLPSLAKTMRDEVAAGKKDFADAQEEVTALEQRASAASFSAAAGPRQAPRVAADERAFGAFISARPWKRAQWGIGFGVIAGAPWVLLGLAGASVPLDAPEGYPELALISAVAPLVLRWVGYGLLFGYFFPLLRGKTGLSKGISFFAAAAAPSVLTALASPHRAGQQWHSAVLLAIQLLIFALTIGLLADLAVLRKNGLTAARLVDLHSLWTVSAWASSVAVAVGTGIATIILAGLQPFVIGVITPSPPSTQPSSPPASVSHR